MPGEGGDSHMKGAGMLVTIQPFLVIFARPRI